MVVGQAQKLHPLSVRRKSTQDSMRTYLFVKSQEVWPEEVLAPCGTRLHPGQLPLYLPALPHRRYPGQPSHLLRSAHRGPLLRLGEPTGQSVTITQETLDTTTQQILCM